MVPWTGRRQRKHLVLRCVAGRRGTIEITKDFLLTSPIINDPTEGARALAFGLMLSLLAACGSSGEELQANTFEPDSAISAILESAVDQGMASRATSPRVSGEEELQSPLRRHDAAAFSQQQGQFRAAGARSRSGHDDPVDTPVRQRQSLRYVDGNFIAAVPAVPSQPADRQPVACNGDMWSRLRHYCLLSEMKQGASADTISCTIFTTSSLVSGQ